MLDVIINSTEIVLKNKSGYKICPQCGRLYDGESNYCAHCSGGVPLVKVRFE